MLTSAVRTKNPSLFPKRFPENALSGRSQKILNNLFASDILAPLGGVQDAQEAQSSQINQSGTRRIGNVCCAWKTQCPRHYARTHPVVVRRRAEGARTHRDLGGLPRHGLQRAQEISAKGACPHS